MNLFNQNISLNTKIPLIFSEEHVHLSVDDYKDALRNVPFPSNQAHILRTIDFSNSEAKLDQWVVTGKGNYVGGWTKRLQKFVEKKHKIKLSITHLAQLSERLARISVALKGNEFNLEITNHANWKPGTFGESDESCWWKTFAHAKDGLIADSGGAILLYEKETPRSRCWYYPIDSGENIVIFNSYDVKSTLNLLSYARMLSMVFGVTYKLSKDILMPEAYINTKDNYIVGISPPKRTVTLMFALKKKPIDITGFSLAGSYAESSINLQSGVGLRCIACRETMERTEEIRGIRHHEGIAYFHSVHIPNRCRHCESLLNFNSDSNWLVNRVHIYCSNCTQGVCFNCSSPISDEDELYNIDDETICEGCFSDYESCDACENSHHADNLYFVSDLDQSLCEDCRDNLTFYCESCEEHIRNSELSDHPNGICNSCCDDLYTQCERCNTYETNDHINQISDESWCTSCVNTHAYYCESCEEYDTEEHIHEDPEA